MFKTMDVEPIRALYSDVWFRKLLGDEIFDAIINYDGNNDLSLSSLTVEVKKNVVLLAAAKGVREILEIPDLQSITSRQDCVDSFQRSALHYAAYYGHLRVITFLLDHLKLNYNHFLDSLGHNAFHYACEGGDLQMVDYLVSRRNEEQRDEGEIEDDIGDNGLVQTDDCKARKRSNRDSIKLGLRKHVTGKDVFVAIVLAARKGNIKVVLRLLNEYKDMLIRLEEGIGTHCNSLLHLLGRSISAQDLRKLKECGLEVDLTTKNTKGIKVLEHLSADTVNKFLDLSVSDVEENIDKNITESYRLKNPFLKRNHSANCNLDLITLLELAKSECHRHLIFHPIFFGICSIKWQYIRKYYFAMLFLFLTFAIIISSVTVIKIENAYSSSNTTDISSEEKLTTHVVIWQIMFVTTLCTFALLEMISLISSNIIVNIIRYSLWVFSIITIIIILSISSHIFIQETSFFIILIPWLICIKHIGHHYILSKYYSNFIEIFKTCIKIFCVFGPLIIAFTLIFHIMMIKNELTEEKSIFQYFHTSSLKTITMMIGDLTIDDFSNKFTNIQWNITFSIFTIIIAFILYNMTNALAVSDTERLIKEADIYKVVSMTKQILLFQNILNNIALFFNVNNIFIPNIVDFTINCNNYQWKIEKFSYEDLCCKAFQSSSQDYVDMRDSIKYFKLRTNMYMIIDSKIANQLRDIIQLNK